MESNIASTDRRVPWNKGKIVGQKAPFKPKDIWAIRVRLQMEERKRELALFNLGIDSKLRACDLTALQVRDVCHGDRVAARACVLQRKTQRPVQFEIAPPAREAVEVGFGRRDCSRPTICSRVGSTSPATLAHASTRESCAAGCETLASIPQRTAPTR